jgi:hypothetical protein
MKIKIEAFVYPNKITVNQSAFVRIGKQEYEAIINADYEVPDGANNMEEFVRTDITLSFMEGDIINTHGEAVADQAIAVLLKEAEIFTPVKINAHPTWPSANEVLARTMGIKFSKVLKKWLGRSTMLEVVKRNTEANDSSCASHDFCDANMAMDEAFTKVMGRSFEFNFDEDPAKYSTNESDTDLMNAAWSDAKTNNFFI